MLAELFFPKKCVGCKRFGTFFCKDCISNIKQGDLVCPICEKFAVGGQTHPLCKSKYGLDGLWSLGLYEGSLKKAISELKYKFVKELNKTLVDILVIYWVLHQPFLLDKIKINKEGWVIVSVPLHTSRKNWRGFNQSEEIGKELSKRLGLDYSEALKRIRFTKPQVKLKGKQRMENIKGAFEVVSNYKQSLPFDKVKQLSINNVLLIDDVWTTGSTLRECCYVLKLAGAKRVWAITLAR